jgi:two-component system, cell cycle sensor histidine kinase and response regulator CckA
MPAHPATVLLVEDDPSMRLMCRVNLELEGHTVLEAGTIGEAHVLLESNDVDLVLLDVHVAGQEGYELIAPIRAKGGAAIALMTGTAEVGPAERALVDHVMQKPFSLEELNGTVRRFTEADVSP